MKQSFENTPQPAGAGRDDSDPRLDAAVSHGSSWHAHCLPKDQNEEVQEPRPHNFAAHNEFRTSSQQEYFEQDKEDQHQEEEASMSSSFRLGRPCYQSTWKVDSG